MAGFARKTTFTPKGFWNGARKRISVGFDPSDFDALVLLAEKSGLSVTEQIRRIVVPALQPK